MDLSMAFDMVNHDILLNIGLIAIWALANVQ